MYELGVNFFQPLWYNDLIKINNKHIIYADRIDEGIYYVYDLLDEDGEFLNYLSFCEKYHFLHLSLISIDFCLLSRITN